MKKQTDKPLKWNAEGLKQRDELAAEFAMRLVFYFLDERMPEIKLIAKVAYDLAEAMMQERARRV